MKGTKRSLFISEVQATQEEMEFYDMLACDEQPLSEDLLSEEELEEICNDPKIIDATAEKIADLFFECGLFRDNNHD